MKKIRLGLIGLGFIGRVHLINSLNLSSVSVVAVSDTSNKALEFARKRGIKQTYGDYHMLLNEARIDAVVIALPTHLHLDCAKEAAESGKHIFLEKPLAKNVEEGKEITSVAEKNGVKLMVGYPYRFSPLFQDLKEKVDNGELGKIQIAHATRIGPGPFSHRAEEGGPSPVPEWWFKKELTGGGVLTDFGSHLINLTRWYFGEVDKIKAYLGYKFNFDFEDSAVCIVEFKSGTTGIINVGWSSQESSLEVKLFGSVAHAYAGYSTQSRFKTAIQLLLRKSPKYHLEELSHFVDCVRDDVQPSPSGEDALRDLETIAQAYKNQIHME